MSGVLVTGRRHLAGYFQETASPTPCSANASELCDRGEHWTGDRCAAAQQVIIGRAD